MSVPIALTIAGSDSGGGAGIQADLKTFAALGVYGGSILTAITAQNTKGVFAIHEVPAEFIAAQMDAVFPDLNVRSVKIGMLGSAAAIAAVGAGLRRHHARNVVLDTVMTASSGGKLLHDGAVDALRAMIAQARLITPNLPEAAALTGAEEARDEDEMCAQAQKLLTLGAAAVLVKGGHGSGSESVDILVEGASRTRFAAPRIETRNTHGTGCTLAAAIAAGLAKNLSLVDAVRQAKAFVTAALEAADRLEIGSGSGPVHHFHKWW
jgi:hydroxymethylpyrimidine/phosphomethylpyrimidine kinase